MCTNSAMAKVCRTGDPTNELCMYYGEFSMPGHHEWLCV